ncbi:hypothetical protein [Streptomyces sp. CS014]|uniref:hypothetical protein n=1 Tax=Streptomyces sp. CS014 TaxID=2162707 RepID=UPI000D50ED36|nr:hypothetical protein [Streptomyces sp. CS014]PVD04497.1 hypothetical protein DBP12_03465 [Streptomyces sp. CS014]
MSHPPYPPYQPYPPQQITDLRPWWQTSGARLGFIATAAVLMALNEGLGLLAMAAAITLIWISSKPAGHPWPVWQRIVATIVTFILCATIAGLAHPKPPTPKTPAPAPTVSTTSPAPATTTPAPTSPPATTPTPTETTPSPTPTTAPPTTAPTTAAPTHAHTTRPTRTPTPAPTPEEDDAPSGRIVSPGAYCSPAGATGRTSKGTPMTCRTAADGKLRWKS